MTDWIDVDRTVIEHDRGFRVLTRRESAPQSAPIEVRRDIAATRFSGADFARAMGNESQPLPSAFALLRQNLAQRIQEWRDRKAERERGTELKVKRIREKWEKR